MRLLITGVPGCGKTVLAGKISRLLKAKLVDVNAVVVENGIYSKGRRGEKLVDLKKLGRILKTLLKREKNVVVESHLLCELKLDCDKIVVLRCNPLVLKKRLEKRGYPGWKVKENIIAEMLDYCSIKAEGNYPASRVLEVDFTKPVDARKVLGKAKSDKVDWMREFARIGTAVKGFLN
ncbi:MAG: AAA family ATPase [Candidatus Norongarragalinales archaeon]